MPTFPTHLHFQEQGTRLAIVFRGHLLAASGLSSFWSVGPSSAWAVEAPQAAGDLFNVWEGRNQTS
jgi:hypothetical protein